MSIVVIYEGVRKVIKIPTPNTLVQYVLNDAAQQFNIDPARAYLQHKRTILENSQPFRFCGLSNNAQVDLICSNAAPLTVSKPCKIALSVDGGDNVTETVDSASSLHAVLVDLISASKLPPNTLQRSPELVYLRASYKGEDALKSTTLASLGLAGQSARLQLRFGAAADTNLTGSTTSQSQFPSSPGKVDQATPVTQIATTASMIVQAQSRASPVPPAIVAPAQNMVGLDLQVPPAGGEREAPPSPPPSPSATAAAPAPAPASASAGPSNASAPMSASVEPEVRAVSTPTRQQQAPSPAECLQKMLAANFDAVSVPAALTLAKYLLNVLLCPEDQRFRSVNTENKVFTSKVLPAKGAAQFLQSVGFRAHPTSSTLQLPAAAADGLSAEQLRLLGEGWDLLQAALTELGVPEQDRPAEASVDAAALRLQREARRSQQAQLEQAVAFDPFRAHIVRAAPQPERETGSSSSTTGTPALSATESQLLELQRKRAELEGRPEDVDRSTKIVFPGASAAAATNSEGGEPMDVVGEEDVRNVPRSVLQKILKRDEDAPLTTQAVRDLQRAQKEKVYRNTLIKIRFPDRASLQGYFHPRHTVQDLYAWVAGCLADPAAPFELYTTPPRTVLRPGAVPAGAPSASSRSASAETPTLSDLKLVPAASIYLAWLGGSSVAESGAAVGGYFSPQLLEASLGKADGATGDAIAYPTGQRLVPAAEAADHLTSGVLKLDAAAQGKSGEGGSGRGGEVKKMSKPKWFK